MVFGYARIFKKFQNLNRQIDELKTCGGPDDRRKLSIKDVFSAT